MSGYIFAHFVPLIKENRTLVKKPVPLTVMFVIFVETCEIHRLKQIGMFLPGQIVFMVIAVGKPIKFQKNENIVYRSR